MSLEILLLNVHSSRNAGDAALTEAAIEQLRENFPTGQITLVVTDPPSYQGEGKVVSSFSAWWHKSDRGQAARLAWMILTTLLPITTYRLFGKTLLTLTPKDLQPAVKAYVKADIIVSTPGGYLYSSSRGVMILILLYSLFLALLAGKPLYLFPQSYGPFRHKRERLLARWVLTRARLLMARETASLEYLSECGISSDSCYVLPDMAFAFTGDSPSEAQAWLASQGIDLAANRPLLGITIIDWEAQFRGFQNQENYENAIASAIRFFVSQYGSKVLLLPQCWGPSAREDDRIPSHRVIEKVSELRDSILMVDTPLAPALLKSVFGQLDLFIGTRMHSNIFALSQGVPVVAIGYLHKTRGIAQSAGIEDWVIDIQQIDEQCLIEKFTRLCAERDSVRAHLQNVMPALIQQTRQAGILVAKDFASLSQRESNG